MVPVRNEIRFLLNDGRVTLNEVGATETLLDFLRLRRRLTGTKEGCAEGDCGACTVLVGRLDGQGSLVYETVNACIRFLGSLDGCHVVTIEHLKGKDGSLHPVQQAMVDEHGSQCGFCTPGIVMSLYALWMRNETPQPGEIERSLQGNLCRCTGYAPILRAAMAASRHGRAADDRLVRERARIAEALRELADGARVSSGPPDDRFFIPASADDLAELLAAHPGARIIAGSTDVGLWVTKQMRPVSPAIFIGGLAELQSVETGDGLIRLGAGVTYSQALEALAARIPQMRPYLERIGGEQVRNMGTIGGNIANGSPIGDMPPALIALGASLTLRSRQGRRSLPLQDFFIDYGKQDRRPEEFVERIDIPLPLPDDRFAAYKISKRRDEDISAIAMGILLRFGDDGRVREARIACGGMAATPKRARTAERSLLGTAFTEADVGAAMAALERDFQPITDWRATAQYRMMAAKNLLQRFWLENRGEVASLRREGAPA